MSFKVDQGVGFHVWKSKQNKAFWRGKTRGHSLEEGVDVWSNKDKFFPRFALVLMSKEHPDLIDA